MPPEKNKPDLGAEIGKYRKALEADPSSRLFAALADALRRSGDIKGAMQVAEEGVKKHPRYISGLVVLAQACHAGGEHERALELFQQVVKMNHENLLAHRALADIYDRLGDHANAMKSYRAITILDPGDVKAREQLEILEATSQRPPKTAPVEKEDEQEGSEEEASEETAGETEDKTGGLTREPGEQETTSKEEPDEPPFEPSANESPTEVEVVADEHDGANQPMSEGAAPDFPRLDEIPLPEEPVSETTPPGEPEEDEPQKPGQASDAQAEPDEQFDSDEKAAPAPEPEPALEDPDKTVEIAPPVKKQEAGSMDDTDPGDPSRTLELPRPESGGTLDQPAGEAPFPEKAAPESEEESGEMTHEDKLDLFFSGADLSQLGIAAEAEGYQVRDAASIFPGKDYPSEEMEVRGPVPENMDADQSGFAITRSTIGALFWKQGYKEKAVRVLAEQVKECPDDIELRREYETACEKTGIDQGLYLGGREDDNGEVREQVARETAPDSQDEQVAELDARQGENEPEPVREGGAGKDSMPEPEDRERAAVPGRDRLKKLRGYLDIVRKNKERKP